jgi:MAF protein
VLASASPRRQALIGLLGLAWSVAPTAVDEDSFLLADPLLSALNIALAKARGVSVDDAGTVVVAADTIVALNAAALGKPADAAAAQRMLASLRGRAHDVISGVAVRSADGREWGAAVVSRVVMRTYSDTDIAAFIARGEAFDKAGGYAVQDSEFRPAERVDGCYLNVVGLPLCALAAGVQALGVAVPSAAPADGARADMRPPCRYCAAGAPLVANETGSAQ